MPSELHSENLRPLALTSYALAVKLRGDPPTLIGRCAHGNVAVKEHDRHVNNKVISVREHCRKMRIEPG